MTRDKFYGLRLKAVLEGFGIGTHLNMHKAVLEGLVLGPILNKKT